MKKVCLWKIILSIGGLFLAFSERSTVYAFPESSPTGIFAGMGNVADDGDARSESDSSSSDDAEEELQSGRLQRPLSLAALRELQRASVNNRRFAIYMEDE